MRSRYSAYATGKVAYILKTTHPRSPHFDTNTARWRQTIDNFCRTTKFIRLEILGYGENWVSFAAHLEQNGQAIVLQENSQFEQVNSHWRYVAGEIKR
jgi:SEC-C motif-containing protein